MYFLYILIMFLSLLGLIVLVKQAVSCFLHIKNGCCKTMLFIPFCETENCDFKLEAGIALTRAKWYNINSFDEIFAVNCSLSKENGNTLKELSGAYGIRYINETDVQSIIKYNIHNKGDCV